MLNQVLIDRDELGAGFPINHSHKADLHHIPTGKLTELVEKYRRRALVIPNDQRLKMRIQFILSEIGMRQMVEDIERDLESDSQ